MRKRRQPFCRHLAGILLFGVNTAFGLACTSHSAAISNEAFSPTEAFGPTGPALVRAYPALGDSFASKMLTSSEQEEVRRALRSVVSGTVAPLVPATFGVRFGDVPRAIDTAARTVDMAVVSIETKSDRFEIELLMLDSQPARLVVDRVQGEEVLRYHIEAGLFTKDVEAARRLGRAFERALHEWGSVPRPLLEK